MVFGNWIFFLTFILVFFIIYCIYHTSYYRKTYIIKIDFILIGVIFFGMYYIYCRYLDPQKIAYYCIDKQCISIIHFYKSFSINSPEYAKVYEGKILFRFQTKINNNAEFLMEDDISISKKLSDHKFIIYGSFPVMHGNIDSIEIKEATGYIDRSGTDYIVSRDLKFRDLY